MRSAGDADAALLASLHAEAFNRPWSQSAFEAFLSDPTVFCLVIAEAGFILWRTLAGEAEILTLAVSPDARRRGIARALLAGAVERSAQAPAEWIFLEVSDQNSAGLALYRQAGFQVSGLRKGYYESEAKPENALVMRLSLTASSAPTIIDPEDIPPRS